MQCITYGEHSTNDMIVIIRVDCKLPKLSFKRNKGPIPRPGHQTAQPQWTELGMGPGDLWSMRPHGSPWRAGSPASKWLSFFCWSPPISGLNPSEPTIAQPQSQSSSTPPALPKPLVAGIQELGPAAPCLPHGRSRRTGPCHLRLTHSLPRGQQQNTTDLADTPSSSYLCWKAVPDPKMFFWASELKADQKSTERLGQSRPWGSQLDWTKYPAPDSTVDSPMANHKPQSPGERTCWEEEG